MPDLAAIIAEHCVVPAAIIGSTKSSGRECACGWQSPKPYVFDHRDHAAHVAEAVTKVRTITSDNIGEICWTPGTIIRSIKTGAVYELSRYAHWKTITGPSSNTGYIDLPALLLWTPEAE